MSGKHKAHYAIYHTELDGFLNVVDILGTGPEADRALVFGTFGGATLITHDDEIKRLKQWYGIEFSSRIKEGSILSLYFPKKGIRSEHLVIVGIVGYEGKKHTNFKYVIYWDDWEQ